MGWGCGGAMVGGGEGRGGYVRGGKWESGWRRMGREGCEEW